MGWEKRPNGRMYFYLSRRVGGKVEKEYYGCGLAAQLADQQLQERKRKRKMDREAVRTAKEALVEPEMRLKKVAKSTQRVSRTIPASVPPAVESTVEIGVEHELQPADGCQFYPTKTVHDSQIDPLTCIQELLARIEHGDPTANTELERFLDQYPALWLIIGDVGEQAIQAWLKLVSGGIPVLEMAAKKKLDALRTELLQDGSDVVARLYADRVIATWLQMTYADTKYAIADPTCLPMREFLARRQQQAQHQHLSALNAWRMCSRTRAQLIPPDQPQSRTGGSATPGVLPFPNSTADGSAKKRATASR